MTFNSNIRPEAPVKFNRNIPNRIDAGCIMCWTHLQTFSVSTILGEASDVEQVIGFLPVAHRHIGQEEDK